MSQPESTAHDVLPEWVDSSLIKGMLRGIERESLRMQSNGFLSQEPHPHALGSALTHPHITTDYSEALMEFITPPKESITEALHYLTDIHAFVHRHLKMMKSSGRCLCLACLTARMKIFHWRNMAVPILAYLKRCIVMV